MRFLSLDSAHSLGRPKRKKAEGRREDLTREYLIAFRRLFPNPKFSALLFFSLLFPPFSTKCLCMEWEKQRKSKHCSLPAQKSVCICLCLDYVVACLEKKPCTFVPFFPDGIGAFFLPPFLSPRVAHVRPWCPKKDHWRGGIVSECRRRTSGLLSIVSLFSGRAFSPVTVAASRPW